MPLPRFSGYAAAPLKDLYVMPYTRRDLEIARQLKAVGDREGFSVSVQTHTGLYAPDQVPARDSLTSSVWSQDHKFFQVTPRGEVLRALSGAYPDESATVRRLGKWLKLPVRSVRSALEGGNFFIGKRPGGQLYALVGRDALDDTARNLCHEEFGSTPEPDGWESRVETELRQQVEEYYAQHRARYQARARRQIARELRIPVSQVHYVSQPDFHIDLGIRPLHGNRVLLNDPALSQELLNEASRQSPDPETRKQIRFLKDSLARYQRFQSRNNYADTDTLEQELTAAGFEVIRIPGVVRMRTSERYPAPPREEGRCVSYANALVHQRPDGKLVYITNASYLPVLDRLFEKTLQARAPWIARVDWISGEKKRFRQTPFHTNDIASHLDLGGGIHCLTNERPDFRRWQGG